jgi:hypothetical protein
VVRSGAPVVGASDSVEVVAAAVVVASVSAPVVSSAVVASGAVVVCKPVVVSSAPVVVASVALKVSWSQCSFSSRCWSIGRRTCCYFCCGCTRCGRGF